MTFNIYWQGKDGGCNHSIVEAQKLSEAVAYVENDERCEYVYRAVERDKE